MGGGRVEDVRGDPEVEGIGGEEVDDEGRHAEGGRRGRGGSRRL